MLCTKTHVHTCARTVDIRLQDLLDRAARGKKKLIRAQIEYMDQHHLVFDLLRVVSTSTEIELAFTWSYEEIKKGILLLMSQ